MSRRALAIASVLVTGAALALAGCSSAAPYSPSVAESLQRQVLAVALAAHSGEYARAAAQLDALQSSDDAALKKGQLTAARHDAIASAIAQIRGDLSVLEAQAQVQQLRRQQAQLLQQQRGAKPPPGGGGKHGHGDGNGGD